MNRRPKGFSIGFILFVLIILWAIWRAGFLTG